MLDKGHLMLHEKLENIKENYDCLANTFYYNYEIMIDVNGNVLIEKTTNTTQQTNFKSKKEKILEINDNIHIHPLILDIYKEILSNSQELFQYPLEQQLKRIINLKNTDPLVINTFQDELTRCRNKMNNYKTNSDISKDLIKVYQAKIAEMKKIIEENKNIHDDEMQKLMDTISNIYRHL
jgi:hypothetical protein